MVTAVKNGTPNRRALKSELTRRRIMDAAEALFVEVGYAATTIAAVAEAADVAVQTVYAVFGNKRTILTELLAQRVVGDDDALPLREREAWRSLEAEVDSRAKLSMLAHVASDIGRRMAPLYDVLSGAAGADKEIAEIFRSQQAARRRDQARVVRSLVERGALRRGLSEAHATDVVWVLANPTTYRMLVGDRRWSTAEYEHWLGELLAAAILGSPAGGTS